MAETVVDAKFLKRVRGQLIMLVVLFLLGMGVNLLGDPGTGLGKTLKDIMLGLHVLVAVGVIVGASLGMSLALKVGGQILRTTRYATAGVGIAFVGGILSLKGSWSDAWSYVMAVGFLLAFVFYGKLYMKLKGAA